MGEKIIIFARIILRFKSRKWLLFRQFILSSLIICSLIISFQLDNIIGSSGLAQQFELVGKKIGQVSSSDIRFSGNSNSGIGDLFFITNNFDECANKALKEAIGANVQVKNSTFVIEFWATRGESKIETLLLTIGDNFYSHLVAHINVSDQEGTLLVHSYSIPPEMTNVTLHFKRGSSRVFLDGIIDITEFETWPKSSLLEIVAGGAFPEYYITSSSVAATLKLDSEDLGGYYGEINLDPSTFSNVVFSLNSQDILSKIERSLENYMASYGVSSFNVYGYLFTAAESLTPLKGVIITQIKLLQAFLWLFSLWGIIRSIQMIQFSTISNERFLVLSSSSWMFRIGDLLFDTSLTTIPAIFVGSSLSSLLIQLEEHVLVGLPFGEIVQVREISISIGIIIYFLVLFSLSIIDWQLFAAKSTEISTEVEYLLLNPFKLIALLFPIVILFQFFDDLITFDPVVLILIVIGVCMFVLMISIIASLGIIVWFFSKITMIIWDKMQITLGKDFYLLSKISSAKFKRKALFLVIITSLFSSLSVGSLLIQNSLELKHTFDEGVPLYVSDHNTFNRTLVKEIAKLPEIAKIISVVQTNKMADFGTELHFFTNIGKFYGIQADQISWFYGSQVKEWGVNFPGLLQNLTGLLVPYERFPVGTNLELYFFNKSINAIDSIKLEVQGHYQQWANDEDLDAVILPIDTLVSILNASTESFESKYLIQPKGNLVDVYNALRRVVTDRNINTIDLQLYALGNYALLVPATLTIHCTLLIIIGIFVVEDIQNKTYSKEARIIAFLALNRSPRSTYLKIKILEGVNSLITILFTALFTSFLISILLLETGMIDTHLVSYISASVSSSFLHIVPLLFIIYLIELLQLIFNGIKFFREYDIVLALRHYE